MIIPIRLVEVKNTGSWLELKEEIFSNNPMSINIIHLLY